jgi:hypothetical protein
MAAVSIVSRLILWATKKHYWRRRGVIRFDGSHLFWRYEFLWPDERTGKDGKKYNRPPWYRPFNVFLHHWNPADDKGEGMHDHPRWSITVCLRGRLIESTPWRVRELRPGSIVVRSRKYIHSFSVPDGYRGKAWTLFIVGRRNHRQNTYVVTPRGAV